MPNANRFGLGCCCGSGGATPCDDGEITVIAKQDCDATSAAGATVTLTLGGVTIGTCTTTSAGCLFTGLSPGTYTVVVVLDGVTRTITAIVGPACTPITVTTGSFGQTFIELVVQGCNGWVGGATFDVYQSGILIGTGTSIGSLVPLPYVRIDFPGHTDGTPITIVTTAPPYFVSGSATFADGTCQATAALTAPNEADGYACCGSSFFRILPYGPTLNVTLGSGDTLTLAGNGFGIFVGTLIKTVPGVTDCFFNTPADVSCCFHVAWDCGTLAIDYFGCAATSKARAADCSVPTAVHISSVETSHVADPLVSTGSIAGGYFAGTWTVTE